MRAPWTSEEVAIIVFLRSRGLLLRDCRNVLNFKLHLHDNLPRSLNAIREKLKSTTNSDGFPGLKSHEVDNWLHAVNIPNIGTLLSFTDSEVELMGPVRRLSILLGDSHSVMQSKRTFLSASEFRR